MYVYTKGSDGAPNENLLRAPSSSVPLLGMRDRGIGESRNRKIRESENPGTGIRQIEEWVPIYKNQNNSK